jgi:hypothetical protein
MGIERRSEILAMVGDRKVGKRMQHEVAQTGFRLVYQLDAQVRRSGIKIAATPLAGN